MNTRNQLLAAHTIFPFLACTLIGGFIITGWLPPPSPDKSFSETGEIFSDNLSMRIGVSIVAAGSPLYMGLSCAIYVQLKRIEGPNHILGNLQMLSSAVTVLAVMLPAYFWLAISYHDDTPSEVVTVFNNLAFFIIIAGVWPVVLQDLCIAVCIFNADPRGPTIYPRWLAYANLWLAIALLPGATIPFFKTGPLTYAGIIGFWLVVIGFFVWTMLMWWFTVKAIKTQASNETCDEPSPEPAPGGRDR